MATPARLDAALTTAAHYKHAEEPVGDEDALLEQLGGMAHIRTFGSESARLKRMIAPNAPLNQHVIYQALGLRALLDHAEFFKKDFDAFCKSFVASTQSEFALDYVAVPVKTHKSADAKVSVDYKGDCAQLKDAVRGTILLTGEPRPDLIERAYALIDRLLRSPLIDGKDVRVLHLKDRYQQPSGSYRDWLLLFNIRGHICELQINLEAAQRRKKDGQHQLYQYTRLANRKMLEGAMQGDAKMVSLLLAAKAMPDTEEALGFRALHFGARHGNEEMINALLSAGADACALTHTAPPELPLLHAVEMRMYGASELLLAAAERSRDTMVLRDEFSISMLASAYEAVRVLCQRAATCEPSSYRTSGEDWLGLEQRISNFIAASESSNATAMMAMADDSPLSADVRAFAPLSADERVRAAAAGLPALEQAAAVDPTAMAPRDALQRALRALSAVYAECVAEWTADAARLRQVTAALFSAAMPPLRGVFEAGWHLIRDVAELDAVDCLKNIAQFAEKVAATVRDAPEPRAQRTDDVAELYLDAASTLPLFRAFLDDKFTSAGYRVAVPRPKATVRVVEKVQLGGDIRRVFDVVRAMITVDSLKRHVEVLEILGLAERSGLIQITRVKDRYNKPSMGGWRDVMINFVLMADEKAHVCELQLAHETIFQIRNSLGQEHHATYARLRNAYELCKKAGVDLSEVPM